MKAYKSARFADAWDNAGSNMLTQIDDRILQNLYTIFTENISLKLQYSRERELLIEHGKEDYRFADRFGSFSFQTFLTKPEVVLTKNSLRNECVAIQAMSLFNTNMTKIVRLDEFVQAQIQVWIT